MDRFEISPWWDYYLYLTGLYGFYYPPASGFAVIRYATRNAFKVINSSLYIACPFGK